MSFDDYFREELNFLREQGGQYSELRPHLSRYLQSNNSDPDVERLLEGFAFLTGRLREKIDDDFPELTHSMINLLWPNFLRPFPSVTIIEFTPLPDVVSSQKIIEKGLQLFSAITEDHTQCFFRTTRALHLYPLQRSNLIYNNSRENSVIQIDFKTNKDILLSSIDLEELSLFLGEISYESQSLYLWFNHFLSSIEIDVDGLKENIPIEHLESVGWKSEESTLPYPKNVYEGYRLLHEYLAFPSAFSFIKINKLNKFLYNKESKNFSLTFRFKRPLPADIRINEQHLRLFCVPAINLFTHDAEPIHLTGLKPEYNIFPSQKNPSMYEIFSVDQVSSWDREGNKINNDARKYVPFESFQHEIERSNNRLALYYRIRTKASSQMDGFDNFISFVRSDEINQVISEESVSVQLTCTNRELPLNLGKGDINACVQGEKNYMEVRNITEPTMPLRPILDSGLSWTLISNLSLNYLSLISKEALRTIIKAYDFRALSDRQAEKISYLRVEEGIVSIETKPIDRIFRGMPIRGVESTLVLNQKAFASEGDLYLFAKVLSHFFSLYASVNSFHDLIVINELTNEKYAFKTQIGSQPLI